MQQQVEAARHQHEEKALALSRLEVRTGEQQRAVACLRRRMTEATPRRGSQAALEEVNQNQRAVESLAVMEEMNRLAVVGPRLTRSTTR
jgi:hypothetical protein